MLRPPTDEAHQEEHDSNHQQDMDERANRVAAHQTEQPGARRSGSAMVCA